MSKYLWTSTSSLDPTLGANWTKDDGTTGTAPGAGDDVYVQAVSGLALANIWAGGGANLAAPESLATTAGSSTGGHLVHDTTYYYYVSAIYASGESPLSGELTYSVGATGTSTNQITVTWAAVTGATGYKIYRSTTTGAEKFLATVGAVLLYADTSATVPAGAPPGKVTFNSLTISQTFTGTVGAAGVAGYWKACASTWNIGTLPTDGSTNIDGSGSGRIKIDFGTVQYSGTISNSGQSVDVNQLPIRILGNHASNALSVLAGKVGIATNQPGETATIATLNVVNAGSNSQSLCTCGEGVTLTTVSVGGGALTTASAITTLTTSGSARVTCNGAVKVTTANIGAQTVLSNRPASGNLCDTLNLLSGAADFSQGPGAGTVAQLNFYAGASLQLNSANPAHITFTATSYVNGGNLALT